MKIYSPDQNFKLNKIQMASKIYRKHIEVEKVQFEPKVSKLFKEHYPQYRLPLLEIQAGKFITGTNSILLYIAGQQNLKNKEQKAKIVQQLQRIQKQVDLATGVLILQEKNCEELKQEQVEKSKHIILKYIKQQNEKLALRTFLVGDRLTIADISSFHNIFAVVSYFTNEIEKLKNISRWMSHMESLDNL